MLSKLFKKKSLIAIGGYDATDIPEINMGAFNKETFRKRIRAFALTYSLKNADRLLVVDDSLIENLNTYIFSDDLSKEPVKDGILNFIPGIRNKIKVLYTGYDENFFKRDESIPKENFVLSAGYSPNDNEFKRKGFDSIVAAAGAMKEVNFVLIGLNPEQIKGVSQMKLPNLKLFGSVNMDELRKYYNRAKVFAQLSLFEGQPNSLCEAMMYECIPVGSNVNGIPRVIGDCGFIVYKKNTNEIIHQIQSALNSSQELGKEARKRIIENFSLEKRKEKLFEIIDEME